MDSGKTTVVWLHHLASNLWHISEATSRPYFPSEIWMKNLRTHCGIELVPGLRPGWTYNRPQGNAQRNGPFCTDCIALFAERLAS